MKGVFIPGMGMPECCMKCQMLEGASDDGICHAANRWMDDDYFSWHQYPEGDIDDSKPLNCPLQAVELPDSETVTSLVDYYDKVETHENCTVEVLTNTKTGAVSVGWWRNEDE